MPLIGDKDIPSVDFGTGGFAAPICIKKKTFDALLLDATELESQREKRIRKASVRVLN